MEDQTSWCSNAVGILDSAIGRSGDITEEMIRALKPLRP